MLFSIIKKCVPCQIKNQSGYKLAADNIFPALMSCSPHCISPYVRIFSDAVLFIFFTDRMLTSIVSMSAAGWDR